MNIQCINQEINKLTNFMKESCNFSSRILTKFMVNSVLKPVFQRQMW